ncbi:hypothetical protein [Nostoc sp.]|uniref:hypothetical protein n=1 Tax=Nostoc sp. TaxID=1180 RepID=UPI002FFBD755
MAVITISDLQHPNSDENQLTELTTWEMRTVEGGRRKRKTKLEGDTSGILSKEELTESVNNWLNNVEEQIVDLRQQLSV